MAAIDYVFDPYVEDGFVQTGFVLDPFVDENYVSQATLGSATLNATTTLTATATKLEFGVASLDAVATQTASASRTRSDSATLSAIASVSAQPLRIKQISADTTANFTASISAVKTIDATATATSTATQSTQAGVIKQFSADFASAMTATVTANATVTPGATLSASATLTSTANRLRDTSATLLSAGDEVTWAQAGSWYEPRSDYWGPLFAVTPGRIVGIRTVPKVLPTTATLSVDAVKTARLDITVDSFATMTVQAIGIQRATATLNSVATQTTQGNTAADVLNFVMSANSTVSARGIFQVGGKSTNNNVIASTDIVGAKTASGVTTSSAQFIQTLTGNEFRLRFGVKDLQANFTTSIDAVKKILASASLSIEATLDSIAFHRKGAFEDTLDSEATLFCNGGRLTGILGEPQILSAFNSVFGILTIFNIDPYRVYVVDSETRSLKVLQETRIYEAKSENRLNNVVLENRIFDIPVETRNLEVQTLSLVEETGTKDRREG